MEELKEAWISAEQAALNAYFQFMTLQAKADVAKERFRAAIKEQERSQ